ncbi:NAD-dependent epimerase/dehydratase family protein [Amycolatopsis sp. NPDC051128]|uniref:NAD-dependent epimerase/dehydratase family protein n=1 Tax=Amycolatopsis sp. NPDC051128 TaxID=3155412 RepID=UPI0034463D29
MKIVVTGGAGFIGANLCRSLVRHHDVVVLDDLSTGTAANLADVGVELRVGSVLDADAVHAACRGASAIVHLAAVPSVPRSLVNPRRSHDTNVTGTLTVLEAARQTGAHVVVASSSSVYGSNETMPKSEDMVCRPTSPYGVTKLAAESYAAAYRTSFGLDTVTFRFFNVFGPLQAPDHAYAAVIPAFLFAALHDVPLTIHGDGDQSRDFTFVDSVVRVLTEAVTRRLTTTVPANLAFGTRTTLNEVVLMLSELIGRPLPVRHQPARAGDIRHSQACPTTLRALFPDVSPVPLRTGLLRTLTWMRHRSAALAIGTEVPA